MSNQIMFSFLPLVSSDFIFLIYRRATDGVKLNNEYRYSLPLSSEQKGIRDNYFVSFAENEGSTQYLCHSRDNNDLTQKWLIHQLENKSSAVLSSNAFFVDKRFIPRISYVIKHTEYGCQVIDVEPYFLRKTQEFGFTIDFRFDAKDKNQNKTAVDKLSLSLSQDGQKNRNKYADKLRLVSRFISSTLSMLFPMDAFDISRQLKSLPYSILKEKEYVFGDGNTDSSQFSGLTKYKPLIQPSNEPVYVFIFQKNKINISREIWKALNGETYSTFTGMKKMFGVDFSNNRIKTIQVDDFSKESLTSIETQLDEIITQFPNSQIVGIFAGIHKDFDASENYSPYYIVKNVFLRKGLAVQAVTIEQVQKRDGLKWSISGVGLQLFVKLGGTPWKVVPQNDNCLIFGISNAHLRGEDGNIQKYYAYSVCFDSSGLYKQLDILSESGSETMYLTNLRTKITETLNNRMTKGITKCAIHIPFKLRKEEMWCIRECIADFRSTHGDIEVVFIKINIDNRFFGYSDFNSKIPLSGSYIELSDTEFLVWFEGLQQGKENLVTAQSVTNPVHIEFLENSGVPTNNVKSYLQDIINLSGANWRGYNAKHTPVSIYYPELIARFVGKFDQYNLSLELGISAIDKAWFV
jgi:hypothetical protein